MQLNNQQKKQILKLMEDPRWIAVEQAVKIYLEENFLFTSLKRDNEFNTIWAVAESEAGKEHITALFSELEEAAKTAT